jgi:hypothetical protein
MSDRAAYPATSVERVDLVLNSLCDSANLIGHGSEHFVFDQLDIKQLLNKPLASQHGSKKTVSCCMTFGGDHFYLGQAISSILGQSLAPSRILLGVDNWGDARDHLRQIRSPLIEIVPFEGHNGHFAVLDSLIRRCDTEYVLLLDSDDFSHPDRLACLLQWVENGSHDLVGSSAVHFLENARTVESIEVFPTLPRSSLQRGLCHAMLYPSALMRTQVYHDLDGFSRFEKFGMDTEFVLRAAAKVETRNVSLPLYFKRRRRNSLTGRHDTGFGSIARQRVLEFTASQHQEIYSQAI